MPKTKPPAPILLLASNMVGCAMTADQSASIAPRSGEDQVIPSTRRGPRYRKGRARTAATSGRRVPIAPFCGGVGWRGNLFFFSKSHFFGFISLFGQFPLGGAGMAEGRGGGGVFFDIGCENNEKNAEETQG